MEKSGDHFNVEAVGVLKKAELVYLREFSLGSSSWYKHPAYLVETQQKPMDRLDGLLALDSLELKWIAFDFENNRISWER